MKTWKTKGGKIIAAEKIMQTTRRSGGLFMKLADGTGVIVDKRFVDANKPEPGDYYTLDGETQGHELAATFAANHTETTGEQDAGTIAESERIDHSDDGNGAGDSTDGGSDHQGKNQFGNNRTKKRRNPKK